MKLCECGCREPTSIAKSTNALYGHVRGEAVRFRPGHHARKAPLVIEGPDLYWLAGLLEGEGSFFAAKRSGGRRFLDPTVRVGMRDADVIGRVANLFERSMHLDSEGMYRVQLSGARAAELMRQLRPLLGVRRQAQVDAALDAVAAVR